MPHIIRQTPGDGRGSEPDRAASAAGWCPLCTGPLLPLGGVLRCRRCAFTVCVGCEPDAAPGGPVPAD